ncbi:MAG: GNAT family N-acetyltransferase [Phenylobacterium sp.]|jgi:GNAT superfamily N-acetyltransferase
MPEVSLHVRPAGLSDLGWLKTVDHHAAPAWIERCIAHDEYLIAIRHGAPVGFMRFSWFWGTLPFMDLIWVAPEWRSKGVGTMLFQFWEAAMRQSGSKTIMTSSMTDEPEPQQWHRRNGFALSGELTFGVMQQTPEVFFVKDL